MIPDKFKVNLEKTVNVMEVAPLAIVGLALFVAAITAAIQGIYMFIDDIFNSQYASAVSVLIDRMMMSIMIIEILETLRISVKSKTAQCRPFLMVGIIAATRQILLITLQASADKTTFHGNGDELLVLVGIIFMLAITIICLKRADIS